VKSSEFVADIPAISVVRLAHEPRGVKPVFPQKSAKSRVFMLRNSRSYDAKQVLLVDQKV